MFLLYWFVFDYAMRGCKRQLLWQNLLIVVASYVFYGWWDWRFLILIAITTVLSFLSGIGIEKAPTQRGKKAVMIANIVVNLGILGVYKYYDFFAREVAQLFGIESDFLLLHLILPVGISFYTFQALSYSIDVYRKQIEPTHDIVAFTAFLSFFPQLVAGPIERATNLLPQFQKKRTFDYAQAVDGMRQILWGLFKKIVIADRLCSYVDWAYNTADYQSGATLALAAALYSIQIYCDFSGYSDMAWGVAKALGFDITRNFRFPYFATTIKEFWRRWHISLTSWFTEYVYFSLGGNRVRLKARWVFNISMVFILSGIWHGASWNFLLWGCLHAVYYLIEYACGIHRKDYKQPRYMQLPANILVFVLVTVAWIFFRIEDFSTATNIVGKIFTDIASPIAMGSSTFTFACNMLLLFVFILFDWLLYKRIGLKEDKLGEPTVINTLWITAILIMITLFSVSADNFVYFQF